MGRYWREWVRERFGDRPALQRDEAIRTVWNHLPRVTVEELFDFFALEYDMDPGLLRPDDSLDKFTAPIHTRNPLRWYAVQPRLEDRASELFYRLGKRAPAGERRTPVATVGEYFLVWAGQPLAAGKSAR
jgi:hypothetical protein